MGRPDKSNGAGDTSGTIDDSDDDDAGASPTEGSDDYRKLIVRWLSTACNCFSFMSIPEPDQPVGCRVFQVRSVSEKTLLSGTLTTRGLQTAWCELHIQPCEVWAGPSVGEGIDVFVVGDQPTVDLFDLTTSITDGRAGVQVWGNGAITG